MTRPPRTRKYMPMQYPGQCCDLYPVEMHGGNGRQVYVDAEAVRLMPKGWQGPYRNVRQVWERYQRPMAVTEARISCTPEAQVRWLWEMWLAASRLRDEGADLRVVTAWSVFGCYDWDSLATEHRGHRESGVSTVEKLRRSPPRWPLSFATSPPAASRPIRRGPASVGGGPSDFGSEREHAASRPMSTAGKSGMKLGDEGLEPPTIRV